MSDEIPKTRNIFERDDEPTKNDAAINHVLQEGSWVAYRSGGFRGPYAVAICTDRGTAKAYADELNKNILIDDAGYVFWPVGKTLEEAIADA